MDSLNLKTLLTITLFAIYAVLLLRPIKRFAIAQSPDATATTTQGEIEPLDFLRWMGLRLLMVIPLVSIQML